MVGIKDIDKREMNPAAADHHQSSVYIGRAIGRKPEKYARPTDQNVYTLDLISNKMRTFLRVPVGKTSFVTFFNPLPHNDDF